MRAVVIENHGGVDALQIKDRPDPSPGPGEVVVRIRATALNHLDLWVRRGIPGVPYPLPLVPGCDGSGIVEALGPGVSRIEIGSSCVLAPGTACGQCEQCARGQDSLCRDYGILGEHRDGTAADFIVVPAVNVLPKPENLSFEEAASIPLVFLTAWHMLIHRAGLRPGETVLIHAAGSGVSTAGIQIAALLGAHIIVTAGSDEKLRRAQELGADAVINYRTEDFVESVGRLTGKRGVDVVFDHIGKDTWSGGIKSLARGGRLVFCGNTSGPMAETSLPHVFFKSLSLLGSTMGSRSELFEIFRLFERDVFEPVVDTVLPLSKIADAHRMMEERRVIGKIVLTPW